MVEVYSNKECELSKASMVDIHDGSLSHLNIKEKEFLAFLLQKHLIEFTPIEISKVLGVTNKTIINRCTKLVTSGFLISNIVKESVRSYSLSEFAKANS